MKKIVALIACAVFPGCAALSGQTVAFEQAVSQGEQAGASGAPVTLAPSPVDLMGYSSVGVTIEAIKDATVIVQEWIKIGEQLSTDLTPLISHKSKTVFVLPKGVKDPGLLYDWDFPSQKTYRIARNVMFGLAYIDFSAQQISGGTDGKGKYLSGVTIRVTDSYAPTNCDMSTVVTLPGMTMLNVGTQKNPVMQMELSFLWAICGRKGSDTFVFGGNSSEVKHLSGSAVEVN